MQQVWRSWGSVCRSNDIAGRKDYIQQTVMLCYVTKGLDNLLSSRECCQSLGILSKKFPEVLYSSDKKEGGCSAGVGLASPASSTTMEVVTPSDLLLQTPSQCILQEDC